MSQVVGSVTANLILNSSDFITGIETAKQKVKEIENSFKSSGKGVSSEQFNQLVKVLEKSNTLVKEVKKSVDELKTGFDNVKQSAKEALSFKSSNQNGLNDLIIDTEKLNAELNKIVNKKAKQEAFFNPLIESANKAVEVLDKLNASVEKPFDKLVGEARKGKEALDRFHESVSGKGVSTNLQPVIEQAQKVVQAFQKIREEQVKSNEQQAFQGIIKSAGKAVTAVENIQRAFSGESLGTRMQPLIQQAQKVVEMFQRIRQEELKSNEEEAFQGILRGASKAVEGLAKFQGELKRVREEMALLNTTTDTMFTPNLANMEKGLKGVSTATGSTVSSTNQFVNSTLKAGTTTEIANQSFGKGVNNVRTLGTTYNTTSGLMTKFGNSTNNANNRLQQHWSKLYQVTSALHSLKVVLSTVSSMFIWTFGMSMWEATKQTIQSKNEMTSYLQQMGQGTGDIRAFNQGLDDTVARFQKLNKFMIGETIAGIGMEFNLSTEEMVKSMEVVAMIQNEYVRAGRKESEASLAVKDILQGEFLRLSRETGVGKQDLIDTGKWQGDLQDVMGLMEALKEVGEARHWDLFASKCRSLNDVISATRNRFSEFGATLIDDVSPAIVTGFNMMIDVFDGLTNSFNNMGVFEKLLGSVGAFFALSSAIMMLVGDINLLDIAMYGYHNALNATIFRVDVATVKEYGLAKAIIAKITGLQAEQVATMGSAKAIATKLLGLDASIVKEYGLKTAIATSVAMRNMDTASTEANTATLAVNTTTMDISTIGYTMNSEATTANTVAKELNEGANLGVFRTLVMMVTGMEAETVASMSATGALWAFISATTVLEALTIVGILVAIAVAFGSVAVEIQNTCSRMKEYNDLIANSDETIQQLKDANQELYDTRATLDEQYYNGTISADEYNQKLKELHVTTDDLEQSTKDLGVAIDHIDYAGKFEKHINNEKTNSAIRNSRALADAMKDQGYDDDQIKNAEYYQKLVNFGNERLYKGLQVYNKQSDDFINNEKSMNEALARNNVDFKDRENWVRDLGDAYADLEEQSWIANTSDDWWEASWAKMGAGLAQMKIDWINFWADPSLGGTLDSIGKVLDFTSLGSVNDLLNDIFGKGLESINWTELLGNIHLGHIGQDIADMIGHAVDAGSVGEAFTKYLIQPLQDAWNNFTKDFDLGKLFGDFFQNQGGNVANKFAKSIDGGKILEGIFKDVDVGWIDKWFNDSIVTPFNDAVNNFVSDPLGSLGISFDVGQFISNLFGLGEGIMDFHQWVYDTIGLPLKTEMDLFFQDPIGYVGEMTGGFSSFITGLLSGDLDISSVCSEFVNTYIVAPFSNALNTGILGIPIVGDILALLGLTDQTQPNASEKGNQVGGAFGQAVEQTIGSIPIVGDILRVLGYISSTQPEAHGQGHGVGSNIKQGVDDGKRGTADLVRDEMHEVVSAITGVIGDAYAQAQAVGSSILNGINSIIQHHSPGVPALLIADEMGEIVNSMSSAEDAIFLQAQNIGLAITTGIQPNTDISFDAEAMAQYQADTMMAMGMAGETVDTTESAFSQLDLNTATTFASIGTTIGTTMTNISNSTKLNYTTIANTTKTQLANMQSQTTKNIGAIKTSWQGMQVALIASAEHIRSETGSKIQSLQNNMATFWRKVQNPALLLGGGTPDEDTGVHKHRFIRHTQPVTNILKGNGFAGSPNIRRSSSNPKGASTGTGISDTIRNTGRNATERELLIDYLECLQSGKPCYAGGWDFDWSDDIKQALLQWHTHFGDIYDPYLYVGKFENDTFPVRGIAPIAKNYIYDAISRTSYDYYFDSRYGSPLEAWNAGHFNCYDGALLVLALANAFGFSGHMVHGSWDGIGHVWAYIDGIGEIDATAIQKGYGFTSPKVAGHPEPMFKHNRNPDDKKGDTILNVNVDLSGANITDENIGTRIGKQVRDEIIDLISPNPSTGA